MLHEPIPKIHVDSLRVAFVTIRKLPGLEAVASIVSKRCDAIARELETEEPVRILGTHLAGREGDVYRAPRPLLFRFHEQQYRRARSLAQ